MAITITPAVPVIAAPGATPDPVLQPGTTVDAQVVQILSADLVRIAIASLSIDVLTEVPLQAGQSLQLAVSQTSDGIRLAVVGQSGGQSTGQASGAQGAQQGVNAASVPADSVTLAPDPPVGTIVNSPEVSSPPASVLTPLERAAVNVVTQTAATRQGSLAPLFANLGAVVASNSLPPKLQQAVTQVLAQQTSLDQNLSGSAIKAAFEKSGIFLEASLASGTVASGSVASRSVAAPSGIPDLKAALIVLRQTLVSALGVSAPVASVTEAPLSPQAAATPPGAGSQNSAAPAATAGATFETSPESATAPPLAPEFGTQEILLPQARVPVAADLGASGETVRIVPGATLFDNAEPHLATAGTVLNLLQEALQELPREIADTRFATVNAGPRGDDVVVRTSTPPPPFRGALPSAQPVSTPSIAPGAPLAATAHHLLGDTDAAIARQTLLQVASLPDRVDTGTARLDPTAPRWSFEIPFATPQGTALAQFEISRDGGGQEIEAAKRVWRARFTIDVEPAGPVHALVALSGEQTSVRMWAERPATAAQLRAGASQLGQALSRAELKPGDIVIRDGAPPQPTPAPVGHFLDRAL